jgi:hypothetical protein
MQGLGEVIMACWTKPCSTNFFWGKQGYMNVEAYGPPFLLPHALNEHIFGHETFTQCLSS